MHEERNFMIFNVSELNKVDFSQVLETSSETIRTSVNGLKTFIKWEGDMPAFINQMTVIEGPYTYQEMIDILSTDEWSKKLEMPVA